MSPLKTNLALTYEHDNKTKAKFEVVAADGWEDYDSDNGEQKISGYAVLNINATKELKKSIEVSTGIDNVFDKAYAVSNTYSDLILLSDGNSGEVMLLNEPGRYVYVNLKYSF
jgi:iron complex outermembrane receptor protein